MFVLDCPSCRHADVPVNTNCPECGHPVTAEMPPPRVARRPPQRLGVPLAAGGMIEILPPAREVPLAESAFTSRPTDPEEGDQEHS